MKWLASLVVTLACVSVNAQTVYRCGPDGRAYSQTACAKGKAVDVGDERSDAQRAAAVTVASRDRMLADGLERERMGRELSEAAPARSLSGVQPPTSSKKPASQSDKPIRKKKRQSGKGNDQSNGNFTVVTPTKKLKRPA